MKIIGKRLVLVVILVVLTFSFVSLVQPHSALAYSPLKAGKTVKKTQPPPPPPPKKAKATVGNSFYAHTTRSNSDRSLVYGSTANGGNHNHAVISKNGNVKYLRENGVVKVKLPSVAPVLIYVFPSLIDPEWFGLKSGKPTKHSKKY